MNETGIYRIVCNINGKYYIGSAQDVAQRWKNHVTLLRLKRHHSIHLQRAWNRYGADNFTLEVIERCTLENLIEREQHYLDTLCPFHGRGYNISPTAGSTRGAKRTPEQIERMAVFFRGRKLTPEHRAKISAAGKGRRHSPATRAKLSEIGTKNNPQRGRPLTEKQRAVLIRPAGPNHPNRGVVRTHEMRRKLAMKNGRPVVAIKDGHEYLGFRTVRDAMEFCGLKRKEEIRKVANGKAGYLTAGGYSWKWAVPNPRCFPLP